MPVADPGLLVLIALIFVLAGTIKGTVGIGLPTASVGMMSQVIDPRIAISLVVFPSLLSNVWQIWRSGQLGETLWRFRVYLISIVIVIAVVSRQTGAIPTATLMTVLGCVIVLFSASSLAWAPPRLPPGWDRTGQLVSGVASGLLGGLTAIWAPPMVTYLMAARVERDAFVRASGVMIFVGTVPLIAGFWTSGLITGPGAMVSIALTVPALIGFAIGERLRRLLDVEQFRRVVLVVFLLMGLNLIRRGLV